MFGASDSFLAGTQPAVVGRRGTQGEVICTGAARATQFASASAAAWAAHDERKQPGEEKPWVD